MGVSSDQLEQSDGIAAGDGVMTDLVRKWSTEGDTQVVFDNSSATRRAAFEAETLEDLAIEISMALLREASRSRLKRCQIAHFLSPHSIFAMLPWSGDLSCGMSWPMVTGFSQTRS
jgi:hypothetical protein